LVIIRLSYVFSGFVRANEIFYENRMSTQGIEMNESKFEQELEEQLIDYGFPEFERHWKPWKGKHSVDFYWSDARLCVEIHGDFSQGIYTDAKRNNLKSNRLSIEGFTVLHFNSSEVRDGSALNYIFLFLEKKRLINKKQMKRYIEEWQLQAA
jgi:very-short-patch-repair endonuclease